MANPSLSRQFTLTNFVWKLRANGHLNGEKIGAVNYLKLSRIPTDIRIYWNSTNNRDTAFSVDELVRGFKINERDEAGNAKTLDNVWLWSEGEIPIEPLSDIIEIEYNGAGDLIEPLLGNKSGAIDKIEKVQVVSAIDKVLQPIKVVQQNNTQGYQIDDFYRINANIKKPTQTKKLLQVDYGEELNNTFDEWKIYNGFEKTGFYRQGSAWNLCDYQNTSWGSTALSSWTGTYVLIIPTDSECVRVFNKDCIDKKGNLNKDFKLGLSYKIQYRQNTSAVYRAKTVVWAEGYCKYSKDTNDSRSVNIGLNHTAYVAFFANGVFENFIKVIDESGFIDEGTTPFYGEGSILPKPKAIIANALWETTYDEALGLYIFKTLNKTSFIAPVQNTNIYISLLSNQNEKKADFKLRLLELSKTSASDCALYLGGLNGIKVPIKTGFELCFNNKKTGMDYAVIEIPAGDIYQIELELLNVYEDMQDD